MKNTWQKTALILTFMGLLGACNDSSSSRSIDMGAEVSAQSEPSDNTDGASGSDGVAAADTADGTGGGTSDSGTGPVASAGSSGADTSNDQAAADSAVNRAPSFQYRGDHSAGATDGPQSVAWASQIDAGDADAEQALRFEVLSNTRPDLFDVQPSVSYPSGTLRYNAKNTIAGTAQLVVVLTGAGGTERGGSNTSEPVSFEIHVTAPAANRAPSFVATELSVQASAGSYEQAAWATDLSDGDGATQGLYFEVVAISNAALFSEAPKISYPSGTLRFSIAEGASGAAELSVRLRDTGGTAFGGVDVSSTVALRIEVGGDDGCESSGSCPPLEGGFAYFPDWPEINSAVQADPAIEARVVDILSQMTLQEKVGQMIQPNLDQVTPEEAKQYKLGSLLNGGGSWPANNKRATAADWASTADSYWLALQQAYEGRGFQVPFMWATDAVHGHNNVFGATVFPHNIGLGAANDPDLIYRIGQVTAKEVAATGLDWTFAPTVAAPRDLRWGRTYEGYSEDPEIIYNYAGRMVEGLQGGSAGLKTDQHVLSNVKHWVGDGGTLQGVDRGVNQYSEEYLINLHAMGYFSGLDAGAQVVMSSFNSWENAANYDLNDSGDYNYKVHGSKYLITDVLKTKMGFDGLVVTDWNGHTEVNGCSASDCPQAVLAGNDVFMVPSRADWIPFYDNLVRHVEEGRIPMSRIDDAVTRILRVKMRADLWNKAMPSERSLAGDQSLLGADEHRALAREAVRKSLVLLKNNEAVLPLSAEQKIYLAGSAIDSLEKQTGGWSLTWQGTENTAEDFPGATTIRQAIVDHIGEDQLITDLAEADATTVALVAIGEDPYAEFYGDIKDHQTLGFARLKSAYAADLATVKSLKQAGMRVVTVFLSGRPMYVNDEINHSDAFVAAWLPGTEGSGIVDLLYAIDGADFQGRLSFSWPATQCDTTVNRVATHIPGYVAPSIEQDGVVGHPPLFAYGYGLSYAESAAVDPLMLDDRAYGCGQDAPDTGVATSPLEVYGRNSGGEFSLRISGAANGWAGIPVASQQPTDQGNVRTSPLNYQGQYDAVHVQFDGGNLAQIYLQYEDEQGRDNNAYLNADATLQFDLRVQQSPTQAFQLAQHCVHPCLGEVSFQSFMPAPSESWSTVKVPLRCFADEGMNFSLMNTPFLFFTGGEAEFDLGNVRLVPRSLDPAVDALSCEELAGLPPAELNEPESYLFESDAWNARLETYTARTGSDWSPVPELVSMTTVGEGAMTEIQVEYASDLLDSDKGIVIVSADSQNITAYNAAGTLEFELFVEDYANNTSGMVVKMESSTTGPDIFLGGPETLPAGQWHSIVLKVSELGLTADQMQEVIKPFVILPAWVDSQLGVKFRFRNVVLKLSN